ncbi:MAG: hypothetical protein ACK5BV_09355 [Bacteroidota bacterium]|jgi:hypothetical protein
MNIIPQTYEAHYMQQVLQENFLTENNGWEITHKPEERAFIMNRHYWMENLTASRWMYYKKKMPFKKNENWTLQTEIELLSKEEHGHFGLVWGFDQEFDRLNRFTVSADGERGLVMHFQKDHHWVKHRYQKTFSSPLSTKKVHLTILKMEDYFYFLVNRKMMYMCERSNFADMGPYFGYYVEPGLFIRSSQISLERIIITESPKEDFEALYF